MKTKLIKGGQTNEMSTMWSKQSDSKYGNAN